VAGERALVVAVGPAGTGKTSAVRPAVDQLRREGRAVFGVAPSAAAAEVLGTDAGLDADTLDKLLVEHDLDRPPDHRYALPVGATVVVDEAAMVPTPKLAALFDLADRQGWRVVLIGDPLQFSAVGRSGMFAHLVDTLGGIELGKVHRFNHEWERDASLRLRRGDTSVIEEYERHDRLHGGTAGRMRRAVVRRWWEALEAGETVSMMAPTNAAVVELNQAAQWCRLEAGNVDRDGPALAVGPYRVHQGDVVATRQNDRRLTTDRHRMVKNRDRWTVDAVHRNGSLSVSGRTGRVRLPADYVGQHVELAYAETSHANQGRTVDRSLLYLDGPTGASGIYVPLTRGRESNEAFVVVQGEETPADVLAEALSRRWIDRPAIVVPAELRNLCRAQSVRGAGSNRPRCSTARSCAASGSASRRWSGR
jgi:ATP-dependent exoDNAse (exonuclease V) alpha subunit